MFMLTHVLFGYSQELSLNDIAQSYLDKYKVPGLAISVIKPDTIYYGVAGVKRVGYSDQIDLDSKFQIASNTKSITATIAALLVEKGDIEWQTKIVDVIPELKGKILTEYESVTLEDLLSNRANIQPFETDNSDEWKNIPTSIESSSNTKLEFAEYAMNLDPVELKDKDHSYSNGGFIIAALALEKSSGQSWNSLIELFNQEFMVSVHSGFPKQFDSKQTYGHKKRLGKYKAVEDEYDFRFDFSAAGNVSASIRDLSSYMAQHLDGILGNDNVISAQTYKQLHYGFDNYSLGWYNGNIGDTEQKFSYHGGSLETFSSAIIVSADRKVAVVILVNADNKNVNELKTKLRTEMWETFGTYSKINKNTHH